MMQRRVLDLETAIASSREGGRAAGWAASLHHAASAVALVGLIASIIPSLLSSSGLVGAHHVSLGGPYRIALAAKAGPAALTCLGALLSAAGAIAQAVAAVRSLPPRSDDSYAALAGRRAPNVETALARYRFARDALVDGRVDDARAALLSSKASSAFESASLRGPAGLYLWGRLLAARGEHREACARFEEAARLDPTLWTARLEADAIRQGGAPLLSSVAPSDIPSASRAPTPLGGGSRHGRLAGGPFAGASFPPLPPIPAPAARVLSPAGQDDDGLPLSPRAGARATRERRRLVAAWLTLVSNWFVVLWALVNHVGSSRGVAAALALAAVSWCRGQGWQPRLPRWADSMARAASSSPGAEAAGAARGGGGRGRSAGRGGRGGANKPSPGPIPLEMSQPPPDDIATNPDAWYISEEDLVFFQYRVEAEGAVPGASSWQAVMDKRIDDKTSYVAKRRTLPTGKTEYHSVTVVEDASPEAFNDFFFDDPARLQARRGGGGRSTSARPSFSVHLSISVCPSSRHTLRPHHSSVHTIRPSLPSISALPLRRRSGTASWPRPT